VAGPLVRPRAAPQAPEHPVARVPPPATRATAPHAHRARLTTVRRATAPLGAAKAARVQVVVALVVPAAAAAEAAAHAEQLHSAQARSTTATDHAALRHDKPRPCADDAAQGRANSAGGQGAAACKSTSLAQQIASPARAIW
jgi:hypothetical protein